MDACHTQEQEKYRSSMFYVGIFQLFLTFVSYNYNLMAKFEIFSGNYHKRFWIVLKMMSHSKARSILVQYLPALHCIQLLNEMKKWKFLGQYDSVQLGSRIGGKVYPRYLQNCWGVHFMHGRHNWQYTRDHNSWLLVMDQNLTDDYFSESGVNVS